MPKCDELREFVLNFFIKIEPLMVSLLLTRFRVLLDVDFQKPIRSGVVGTHLMVDEVGRQIYHGRVCMECYLLSLIMFCLYFNILLLEDVPAKVNVNT